MLIIYDYFLFFDFILNMGLNMEFSIYKKSNYDTKRKIFKFNYRSININDKRIEEDLFAFNILNDPKYIENVINISRMFSRIIRVSYVLNLNKFYKIINQFIDSKIGSYPVLDKKFNSHLDLADFFLKETNHVRLMSIFWLVFGGLRRENLGVLENTYLIEQFILLNKIYNDKVFDTKEYYADGHLRVQSLKNYDQFNFGSMNFIKLDNGFRNNFLPFARSIDYIEMKMSKYILKENNGTFKKSYNVNYNRYIKKNIPLASGLSGMINLSCKSLVFMNSDFRSNQTIQMLESLCALIVATNMHSYSEVYDSLNLYLAVWKPKYC